MRTPRLFVPCHTFDPHLPLVLIMLGSRARMLMRLAAPLRVAAGPARQHLVRTVLAATAQMHCAPAPGGLWCRFASTKPSVSAADLIVEVNSTNFQAEVVKSAVPVILDCYADWCGPCQKLTPMLEKAVRPVLGGGCVRGLV